MRPRGPGWLFLPVGELPPGSDWLGPREADHLTGLRVPKRRRDWLLGRWTAKQALLRDPLSGLAGLSLSEIEVLADPSGAPSVWRSGRQLPICVSISHRAGGALCALSLQQRVGCDLEWVEERSAAFEEDYFTVAERRRLPGARDRRALVANVLWSAKESGLKLLGSGLKLDPRGLEVELSTGGRGGRWQPLEVHISQGGPVRPGWWRHIDSWVLTIVSDRESEPPVELVEVPR